MSWNHRVIKSTFNRGTGDEEIGYSIHEVYYKKDGSIKAWSIDAIDPYGSTIEELRDDLARMCEALNKPILEEVIRDGKECLEEI